MKKVSTEQIKRLYQFTRQHFVEYYDVQTELVDHLANAIEKRWEDNPEEGFELALQSEFRKFGVFGFAEIVEKRQKAMRKRYYKLMWSEALEFLRMPKVILTGLTVFVLIEFLLRYKYTATFLLGVLGVEFAYHAVLSLRKSIRLKKQQKNPSYKRYLLDEIMTNSAGIGAPILLFNLLINPFIIFGNNPYENLTGNIWFSSIFALVFLAAFIANWISFQILPQKKEEILEKAYPERKFG